MNNLYRELAPVNAVAWEQIEEEAARTFRRHIAGRRVVDVTGPLGPEAAATNTGHLAPTEPPADGIEANLRVAQPMVRLRVPFIVSREDIDNAERGAEDSDWDPVKEAARRLAFAEDRAIFEGTRPRAFPVSGPTRPTSPRVAERAP
ncbi:family 1 encapsulin nanocompartment shell protein [Tessaracoccus coleopterorum]|uniref:family 1 encapsulin nanocompartment shell protein n=1 Tax=Tessaracoccus coleopterorum TaxID=2714950 RepID=UPI0022B22A8C|nr:family 1 encapsulin nanocompartment shell protein [Tessaracoccus coleopterorum]